jgi:RHS repeat-associated protein
LTYDLRFPGQQYDSETGHNYNYLRDYDSTSGRYLESDFIGLRGGINTYLYVLDNPLSRIDAYGLCGCKICEDNYKKDLADAQDNFKSDTTAGCIFWEAIEDSNDCFDNAYKVLAASITLANLRRSQCLKDHGCPE